MDSAIIDIEELIAEDLERIETTSLQCGPPNENYNDGEGSPIPPPPQAEQNEQSHPSQKDLSNAEHHFDAMKSRCLCHPSCVGDELKPISLSFAALNENDRRNIVRGMLLALSAPSGEENALMRWSTERAQKRKGKRRRSTTESNVTTRYALRGAYVCQFGFSAVVQLHIRTIQRYAQEVSQCKTFELQSCERGNGRKGRLSLQTVTAVAFLRRFADVNALSCPTGRGSMEDSPIQWLSNDVRREDVYNRYRHSWAEIVAAAVEQSNLSLPECPLSKTGFLRVWASHYPTLKILKAGSDFCDQCTTLLNTASATSNLDLRETLLSARRKHRTEALHEFLLYRQILSAAMSEPQSRPIHMIFDFAEKVLLPHLLRQPGQLHFVTGIKFDMFGVYSSTNQVCYVYGLPEGHWPNNKTCNEVASMLHYAIQVHRLPSTPSQFNRSIDLHADNCSGQNKNRYMLWYLLWRVCMGFEDTITLRFLVAGHTKNRCDAALGMVKRRLKQFDVYCARDMMKIINESAATNKVVCATNVDWRNWKELLARFFTIPSAFKLSGFHVFQFSSVYSEGVEAKCLSTDQNWTKFKILKRGVTQPQVIEESQLLLQDSSLVLPITSLDLVPSAQEGNRKAYLVKNVLDRYYENDHERRLNYFGSGADWNNS